MDFDIRDAARAYIYPDNTLTKDKKILEDEYRKEFGDRAWKEACTKARTEYNFGSSAVKW